MLFITDIKQFTSLEAVRLTNKESGVYGISGVSSDFRELDAAVAEGNQRARLAIEVFCYDVKKYIGSYAAVLNGVDLIVFTGGIGENNSIVREMVCNGLEYLGVDFDSNINQQARGVDRTLSKADSKVRVMTITTDEELVIATDTMKLVKSIK